MTDITFCSYCTHEVGGAYIDQQKRLEESILKVYPDVKLIFFNGLDLPPGARDFHQSYYGFKPHLINTAYNLGYKKIVYLDTAMILQGTMQYYDSLLEKYGGVLAVQDDNLLLPFTNLKCREYFNLADDWFNGKHLVGGSFYYFDLTYNTARKVLADWKKAEENNIFGGIGEDVNAGADREHRSDETVMAICLYNNGTTPIPYTGSRYNLDTNPLMIKKHFK